MKGYHITRNHIFDDNSTGTYKHEFLGSLEYLTACEKDTSILYDLDASVAALLSQINITKQEATKLNNTGRLYIAPFTIKYYPSRLFCIDRGFGAEHHFINFYDAKQYNGSVLTDEDTPEYCKKKAELARITGDLVTSALLKLDLPIYKLTSPIALYLKGRGKDLDLPVYDDIPPAVDEFAYQCIKGNWLEAYACGYWEKAYDYDINGAYASEMAKLPDIRRGKWIDSKEIPDYAMLGFAKCKIETYNVLHPFITKTDNGNCTRNGEWEDFYTLQAIKYARKYAGHNLEILEGHWWIPTSPLRYPMKEEMEYLYNLRQTTDNPYVKKILHRIMAGLWGKMSELHKNKGFGKLFNSVYAAAVESNVRIKVAKACCNNAVMPLHIAVDGIITNKPLEVELSDKLGGWRLSHTGNCIVVNSGVVAMEGKNGKEEFSLRYDWLKEQIDNEPDAREYVMSKFAPVKLAKALATDRLGDLGKVEEVKRTVYITADNKRLWKQQPKTGKELLGMQEFGYPLSTSLGFKGE